MKHLTPQRKCYKNVGWMQKLYFLIFLTATLYSPKDNIIETFAPLDQTISFRTGYKPCRNAKTALSQNKIQSPSPTPVQKTLTQGQILPYIGGGIEGACKDFILSSHSLYKAPAELQSLVCTWTAPALLPVCVCYSKEGREDQVGGGALISTSTFCSNIFRIRLLSFSHVIQLL